MKDDATIEVWITKDTKRITRSKVSASFNPDKIAAIYSSAVPQADMNIPESVSLSGIRFSAETRLGSGVSITVPDGSRSVNEVVKAAQRAVGTSSTSTAPAFLRDMLNVEVSNATSTGTSSPTNEMP
jgi:hypothetical protein